MWATLPEEDGIGFGIICDVWGDYLIIIDIERGKQADMWNKAVRDKSRRIQVGDFVAAVNEVSGDGHDMSFEIYRAHTIKLKLRRLVEHDD